MSPARIPSAVSENGQTNRNFVAIFIPMELSPREYYSALKARDARFDGRFFVCVHSTGIYCRPVCPARTPRFEHCRFVRSAAAAEAAGYRSCLRCRPETAPGSQPWLGGAHTVQRALRLISELTADGLRITSLAERLGVSDRQLRRLFRAHLGATPKSIAQTERFAIAKQLLIETRSPMSEVAMASGFQSLRRFNDATRATFGMTPSEFRRRHGSMLGARADTGNRLKLTLGYRAPFAWREMMHYLTRRAVPGLEIVDGGRYTRAVRIGAVTGTVSIEPDPAHDRLFAEFALERTASLNGAVQRVRDLFDLNAAPELITNHLGQDPLLARTISRSPGLRIPGCWSLFEMLIRAIVGQQVSVEAATTILGRIVGRFGLPIDEAAGSRTEAAGLRVFPDAAELVGRDLRSLGLTRTRAETLARVVRLFADEPDHVNTAMDRDEARRRLLAIRGIGPWTAEYVALRALRDPDAFPASDLGVLKAAAALGQSDIAAHARSWRPWRAYAVLYLWKALDAKTEGAADDRPRND